MIVLNDRTVGIWYFRTLPDQDVLAGLEEIASEEKYKLTWRFRYYRDEEIDLKSKDKKTWYEIEVTGTRNLAIFTARHLFKLMKDFTRSPEPIREILNDGDVQKLSDKFRSWPECHEVDP